MNSSGATKGKQATRGEKTIMTENRETLNLYRNAILIVMSITLGFTVLLYGNSLTLTFYVMHTIAAAMFFGAYKFMSYMATVRKSTSGEVIDCGTDLNMQSGMAEHCKDIIILTAIVQVLAMFSQWFWILLLLAPMRAFYLFWIHIAAPWIFAPAPEEEHMDEKRQRRMERRQTKFKRA